MRFAAIDVGSNAVRLLLCHVHEQNGETLFKKSELIRMPIRLGEDVFTLKYISGEKAHKLVNTMKAFKILIDVFEAYDYRACATSAMREATNGLEVVQRIQQEAGLNLEIIEGSLEAQIIYSNHIEQQLDPNATYLYIDVGGGSTELTLFNKGRQVASKSFDIGTIRLLHGQVSKDYWEEFKLWIRMQAKHFTSITAIGSGGNINKLFKMLKRKDGKPMFFSELKAMNEMLSSYTYEERIALLSLNPDRADVIIPAAKVFLTVMKNAGIEKILVPQIGLSDGLIHLLYEKYKGSFSKV
jgi:exopolyphosphatase/guanosine-5'-triphosphate,3'-diphosphate pyrophosphatase